MCMDFDEAMDMVHKNRELHPGGMKVYMVSQKTFDEQEMRIAKAIREKEEAVAAMDAMSMNLRLNRVALAMALAAMGTMGWLIGLMM